LGPAGEFAGVLMGLIDQGWEALPARAETAPAVPAPPQPTLRGPVPGPAAARAALAAVLDDPKRLGEALAPDRVKAACGVDRALAAAAGVSKGLVAKVLKQRRLKVQGGKLVPVA
jgi:hypothetical protein